MFEFERAYTAALADKVQPIWAGGATPLDGRRNVRHARVRLRRSTTVRGDSFARPLGPHAGASAGGGTSASRNTAGGANSLGDPEPRLPEASEGGVGHPELCARPCIFFASKGCALGSDCPHCHLPHAKHPAQLDKRRRQMLSEMTADEVKSGSAWG